MQNIFEKKSYSKSKGIAIKSVQFLYNLIKPNSNNENLKRREFILNILLLSAIILSAIATIIRFIDAARTNIPGGISPEIVLIILFIFLFLYFLSRKGFFIAASYIFILIYFVPTVYIIYKWGADIQIGLLFYALIIVMSGILISTRFAFIITLISSLSIIIVGYLQINNIIHPDLYWKMDIIKMPDAIVFSIIFSIIAIVSWLSNREIEKSLKRARRAEAEVRKERDMLEIRVEKRTQELKKAQMEKMTQLYRFAEFGQLSSGLFHDLINPLTAVSLNLEQVKSEGRKEVTKAKSYLSQALSATKRMEDFIVAVRKQIQKQKTETHFSLSEEIIQVIQILSYKAHKAKVDISFSPTKEIKIYGDAIKFSQLITNLISNAIDAYEKINKERKKRKVQIKLQKKNDIIYLAVEDWGAGIPNKYRDKIFEPFFTTKGSEKGTGIGLSSTKNIIEKSFKGSIKTKSQEGEGTKFTVEFPAR